jgi:galactose-1-phosphate uridylyltransferase
MSTTINQETMQQLNDIINNLVTQYCNGLLTNIEFAHAAHAATKFIEGADLTGLIDVNTGLRY